MRHLVPILLFGLIFPQCLAAHEFMFPLPKNADKPSHIVLQPSVAEQDYFWITEKFPGSSVFAHYRTVLANWRKCSGPQKDWVSFADVSKGKDLFVHERISYWVSKGNDAAVVVIAKYESKGTAWRDKPDSDEQFVAVVKYKIPEATKMLATLKVSCEPRV